MKYKNRTAKENIAFWMPVFLSVEVMGHRQCAKTDHTTSATRPARAPSAFVATMSAPTKHISHGILSSIWPQHRFRAATGGRFSSSQPD